MPAICRWSFWTRRNRPLDGFARKDCSPLKGNYAGLRVSWSGGESAPEGARKAKFYLKRAFLYGFEFQMSS